MEITPSHQAAWDLFPRSSQVLKAARSLWSIYPCYNTEGSYTMSDLGNTKDIQLLCSPLSGLRLSLAFSRMWACVC